MSYLVLARKYRPTDFDGFVGQDAIAETLRNAIRMDRVAHAYLFCGPRGVGKTSMARVFAKALNCQKGPTPEPCGKCERCQAIARGQDVDVIEIDGASNRGIDEVRDIRQNARYAPVRSRFKVYYIDEVHMLTEPAFNAILKTLEEPPPHVKFIMATTAPAKLPETILSRVQRFDFRRISNNDIFRKLKEICAAEKLAVPDDVLGLVARRARGSMRDALSLLDKIISFCGDKPQLEAVAALLGAMGDDELLRILSLMRARDAAGLLRTADDLLARGIDVVELLEELINFARDLLVARTCGPDSNLLDRPEESANAIASVAKDLAPDYILYMAEVLNNARRRIREGQEGRVALEMGFIKLAQAGGLVPIAELVERLAALEEGVCPQPASASPAPPADAQDLWQRFLAELHKRSRSSWLRTQAAIGHFQRIGDGEVVMAFPADRQSARAEVEKPETRRLFESVLSDLMGKPVTLRVVSVASEPRRKPDGAADLGDPLIQETLQKFNGDVVT